MEENILVVKDDRFILRVGSSARPFLEFVRPPLHSIGVQEGPQHAMIGTIADSELRRHALYYADGRSGGIRVYDCSGSPLTVLGRPGNGPRGFLLPNAGGDNRG